MRNAVALCALIAVGAFFSLAGSANADYGKAKYQIAFSSNCNNLTLCGPVLGGDWGWAALNADGTGDLITAFCGHAPGLGGGGGEESVDIYQWTIQDGMFFFVSTSDPSFEGPTPIPAKVGHFWFRPAPGINVEGQVTLIPSS